MASRASKRVIYAALVGNLLVASTKFVASGLTGSSAMASEAIHSLVDTGNEILLLYGLHRAAQRSPTIFTSPTTFSSRGVVISSSPKVTEERIHDS